VNGYDAVMCMFSRAIESVSSTTIFARGLADGGQALAYAMELAAAEELAMVLPLPVPANGPDDAVRFVSLERYPTLFADLKRAFPLLESALVMQSLEIPQPRSKTLRVQTVGAFEASFVPHPRDFARLDARFRLPPRVLDALPQYADWGFAVFQLRASRAGTRVHPMALVFPRRDPAALFFPTVHVHDGSAPATAEFDHMLYAQLPPQAAAPAGWTRSDRALGRTVDTARAGGLIDAAAPGIARALDGELPNVDQWLR